MDDLEKIRLEFVARALALPSQSSWEDVSARVDEIEQGTDSVRKSFESSRKNLTAQMGWLPQDTSWRDLVHHAQGSKPPIAPRDYGIRSG